MCTVDCSGAINVTFGANEEAPLFELWLWIDFADFIYTSRLSLLLQVSIMLFSFL